MSRRSLARKTRKMAKHVKAITVREHKTWTEVTDDPNFAITRIECPCGRDHHLYHDWVPIQGDQP